MPVHQAPHASASLLAPKRPGLDDEDRQLLESLIEVTGAARSAGDFHDILVLHLARVLQVRAVLVVELGDDGRTMTTRAAAIAGALAPDFQYDLAHTPCEQVVGKEVCVYADGVAETFPRDAILTEWGIRAYAGAPLFDSAGRAIGVIAVLDTAPLRSPDRVSALLSLFAHRTAAELERQQALERLARTESRLRSAFNNGVLGGVVVEGDRLTEVNDRLCQMLGRDRAELIGRSPQVLTHPDDLPRTQAAIQALTAGEQDAVDLRKRYLHADGSAVHARVRVTCERGPDGQPVRFTAFAEDMSEQVRAAEALARATRHDPVTGLANRTHLFECLQADLAARAPGAGFTAVLLVDIDHFNDINTAWGHATGNALLARVGDRLRDLSPASATVARIGNDEFAILSPGCRSAQMAVGRAARMVDQLRAPFALSSGDISITVSVGLSWAGPDGATAEALIDQAMRAMHAAMETRNTWRVHSSTHSAADQDRIRLGNDLGLALADEGAVHAAFQPIVDARTGRLRYLEALARWDHPELGRISPGTFIPIAESRGLIGPLTHQILRQALDHVLRWRRHDPDVRVTVNISALEFRSPRFVDRVRDALAQRGLPGDCLVLELTETVLDDRPDESAALMNTLRDIGVRFALDDFGTGFSSLRYLKRMPFSILKVAQEFVRDMEGSQDSLEIVRAVVSLGQALDLEVVAEGIETPADAQTLTALGCHVHQGFLYHRPLPPEAVGSLLSAR